MKIKIRPQLNIRYLFVPLLLLYTGISNAVPVEGKLRKWTRLDGKSVKARLVDVSKETIKLQIKGKRYSFKIEQFSPEDRKYVREQKPKPLAGKIGEFPLKELTQEQEKFISEHAIHSLSWNGDKKEQLRFLLYEPNRQKIRQKIPLIIHLCGTGGVGRFNLKPLFEDGGGTAKNFFDKKLQGTSPCYVMIPQPDKIGDWFCASYTEPSDHLQWIVTTIKHLVNDPQYNIDADRVYVTGLSMGGAGVYQAIAKFPEVFAAGIPISFVETVSLFNAENSRPLWIVVNEGDLKKTKEILNEFEKTYKQWNSSFRVTINKTQGHNAWSGLLNDQKFRTWLFRCKRDDFMK